MELSELSIEQQFKIDSFFRQVEKMNLGQAQQMLKNVFVQTVTQQVNYEKLIKHQWGLENIEYQQIKHDLNLPEQSD